MVMEQLTVKTMTCKACDVDCQRFGRHRNGLRRFRCPNCKKTYTEPHQKTLGEMYIPEDKMLMAVKLMVEGNSVRSIQRITDLDQNTIMKILVLAGAKCERVMGALVRNVKVQDVEADEVWSFVGMKEKRVRPEDDPTFGDAYVYVAIERHSKLVLNVTMGKRDQITTNVFIEGLRDAITSTGRFQMSTDGFGPYKTAIPDTFGDRVDFAMLIKVYKAVPEGERRYSPAEVSSVEVVPVCGQPDYDMICTSIVERSNLSVRMGADSNDVDQSFRSDGDQRGAKRREAFSV